MIDVYVYRSAWGIPNPSPFCTKLIAWLRLAGIEHKVHEQAMASGAPKGKLPFARIDGKAIADSQLIIDSLIARHGDTVDGHLSTEAKATSRAFRVMLEEHFYFANVYYRFVDDAGWNAISGTFMGPLPMPLRVIAPPLIRRDVAKNLRSQGMGRHSREEIAAFAIADLEAFVALLGDKPFALGDKPTLLDATAYGFVSNLLESPGASPMAQWAQKQPRLVEYNQRVKALIFPELPAPRQR